MKAYNKWVLGILIAFAILITAGCSSVARYQNSIFHDQDKIVKEADSYKYLARISNNGKGNNNEYDVKFTSFSGMDTIYTIKSQGENDVEFTCKSVVEDGEFKAVLITPDDEVIEIVNGTEEVNKTITIKDGLNRIKLVGRKAKGQISIEINAPEDVHIKKVD